MPLSSVIYDRTTLRLQIKRPLSSVIFESQRPEGWGDALLNAKRDCYTDSFDVSII